MTRLSVRRLLGSQQFWGLVIFSMIPVFLASMILGIRILRAPGASEGDVSRVISMAHQIYLGGYLQLCVIFTAAAFGATVIRQEMEEQTFHYFLLSPMPRWMIVAGKFSGFMLTAGPLYALSLVLMKGLLFATLGSGRGAAAYFAPKELGTLCLELLVLLVALTVYSSLFMALSNFFKNVLYALFVYGWEISSNLLPETLRNFTISYHLKAMLPYAPADRPGFIGMLAEGPGPIQVFLVLTGVFIVCTTFSGWFATRKQCLYG